MSEAPRSTYQRSARNYLLDKPFQLKYTGFLVAIALVMSGSLGVLLWYSSKLVVEQSNKTVALGKETVEQGRDAVTQGEETIERSKETVERGKQVIDEARKVSEVVTMQIDNCYGDNPILKDTFKKGADEDETKRQKEQDALTADAEALEGKMKGYKERTETLEARAKDLDTQTTRIAQGVRNTAIGVIVALATLVLVIGVAGIVFTHKIAGPIFKMKRLMRQVGEGKLVLREKLRKGDELHHFFETFEKMVENMRENQRKEIKRVEQILEKLDAGGSYRQEDVAAARASLEGLVADMKDHIEA
jgi:methyl-accepting chemotaxis protein